MGEPVDDLRKKMELEALARSVKAEGEKAAVERQRLQEERQALERARAEATRLETEKLELERLRIAKEREALELEKIRSEMKSSSDRLRRVDDDDGDDWIECPSCAERIKAHARICKHCGRDPRTVSDRFRRRLGRGAGTPGQRYVRRNPLAIIAALLLMVGLGLLLFVDLRVGLAVLAVAVVFSMIPAPR